MVAPPSVTSKRVAADAAVNLALKTQRSPISRVLVGKQHPSQCNSGQESAKQFPSKSMRYAKTTKSMQLGERVSLLIRNARVGCSSHPGGTKSCSAPLIVTRWDFPYSIWFIVVSGLPPESSIFFACTMT